MSNYGVTIIERKKRGPSKSEILLAKMAKSINFKVIETWGLNLGGASYYEMAVDFDSERYYEEKKLIRRSRFQAHVRKNIEHMLHTGIFSEQEQVAFLADFKKRGGTWKHLTTSVSDLEGDDIE